MALQEINIQSRTVQGSKRNGQPSGGATLVTGGTGNVQIDFPALFAEEMSRWFVRDTENKALRPADVGEEAYGLYSNSYISAKGANDAAGGTVSGVTELSKLSDVQLGTLADGQVLAWDVSSQKWVNKTLETGLDETALADYLTSNQYVTQQWVTGALEQYVTTEDLTEAVAEAVSAALAGKVDTAFFARLLAAIAGDGTEISVNDMETVIASVRVKFGLWSDSWISAKGQNPDAGGTVSGATDLDGLSDVTLTNLQNGQVLMYNGSQWVNSTLDVGLDETALAQYLTSHLYATQSWVNSQNYATEADLDARIDALVNGAPAAFDTLKEIADVLQGNVDSIGDILTALGNKADKTITITAGTGLTGGGNLSANRTISLATVGTAGTYTKVTVDAYGRVTGHSSLVEGDIPALGISKITGLQTALDAKLDAATFNDLFEKVEISTGVYAIRAKYGLYSNDWISAKGANDGAGGSVSGVTALRQLSDVTLSTLANGQALVWNGSKWVNKTIESGLDETALAQYLTNNGYVTQGWATSQFAYKTGTNASGTWPISVTGQAGRLSSTYTGNGGAQPPSYFNGMGLKVNMMNIPVSYSDVIVVNGYGGKGADAPYINAIAFQKTANAHGEVYHARAGYGASSWGTWYKFLDEYNYTSILDSRYLRTVSLSTISDLHSSWDAVLKAQKPAWLTTVSLATISDLHASWDALLKAAPTAYVTRWPTAAEVGALTQSTGDARYVKKAGDTMTGALVVKRDSDMGVRLVGDDAYGYLQFGNTASSSGTHKGIIGGIGATNLVSLDIRTSNVTSGITINSNKVWHAGNDGSGSGLDADLLDGLHLSGIRSYGYAMQQTTIDASGLNQNTWYPVTINLDANHQVLIAVIVSLDSGTKPSWSTHQSGFSVRKVWYTNGAGWGTNPVNRTVLFSDYSFTSTDPVRGLNQLTNSSNEYVYVRGGGKYYFYISHGKTPVLRTSTYTVNKQSVSPTTTAPAAISRTNALITDNVYSATQLQTARTINGTAFNGTSNIVTSYWGTARTLSLTGNATGSVSMNGSSNVSMSVNVNYASSAGNADTLDGYHEGSFFRDNISTIANETITNIPANRSGSYILTRGGWNGAAFVLHAATSNSNVGFLVPGGQYANVKLITCIDYNPSHWSDRGYIITSTNIGSYNAGSATKLQTARTIWGQSFNGTANVSGNMTGVGSITGSGNISMSGSITAGAYVYSSGWFQNQQSGEGLYNGAVDARWYATSGGWISDKKINANAGLGVSGTTTLGAAVQVPYSGSSWISMATRTNLIYSTTNNSRDLAHALYRVKANNGNALCFGGLGNNLGFYAFTAANISSSTNVVWKNTYWDMTNWTLHHGGVLHCTGGIYSDSYVSAKGNNSSSDIRLKNILCNIHPSLEAFAKAPLFRFSWKSNPGMVEIGSSAQYWRNVLPDTVKERDGWLEMGYGNIALAGVITIARDFETLEQRVDRLEKENGKLKKRIKELERRAA